MSRELQIVPITLDEANQFVRQHHRHHRPVPGAKFCLAVAQKENVVGVAIVGRPVARLLDDGWTLEVNRTCTDGTKNANSALYGACRRAAWAAWLSQADYLHAALRIRRKPESGQLEMRR